ncbi:MAG: diadenylate cyclase [Candidatus Pacebacteria bacterium]|nr:diadenylate cyclase [Candidatus Paceibacterota bacterium]
MFGQLLSSIKTTSQFGSVSQSVSAVEYAIQNISLIEIADIAVVALAIYVVLLFIKQTRSYFLIGIVLILIVVSILSQNLDLALTRAILQPVSTLIFIIIAIVFQREIRRFFKWIATGQSHIFSFSPNKHISKSASGEVAEALLYMSAKKIGGIIVFTGKQDIDDITEGGNRLGGEITKEIILSIFDTSSAGHDGAIIIENDSIKQFGVHLPLAREYSDYRGTGTRHRASAGITEDTDSVAFSVSEERGTITVYREGKPEIIKDEEELRDILRNLSGETDDEKTNFWKYFFFSNLGAKAAATGIALVVWLILFTQSGITRKEYTVPVSFQLIPANLELDSKSGVKEITITLEGKTRDIGLVAPENLQTKIDAKDFKAGYKRIDITRNMINVPSFVDVITIEPKSINVNLLEKVEGPKAI